MTERKLPAAVTGTEMRLDAVLTRLDRLCDLLTPAAAPEPDPARVELREPAMPPPAKREPAEKRKRLRR